MDWAKFLRDLVVEKDLQTNETQIGGEGKVIEIDETLLTWRKYNLDRLL